MRRWAICLTLLGSSAFALDAGTPAPLAGYTAQHSTEETAWEQKFRAMPDPARLRESMKRLSARPHHVGSAYDKDNAEWLLAQLKSYGLDAKIEVFESLFPTPRLRKLELLGATKFTARLDEPVLKIDPTSGQKSEQLPTYNAFSRDGDVTAPLVYVNYGAPDDYEKLAAMGVSVKGAIVIVRYGQTWRGIKPKLAAQHGAVGCLIYSDPKEDGYTRGTIYPEGPMRPPDGVQRGSVMDMPVYPGDPQSPGFGATPGGGGGKLIPLAEVQTITKIPVMPISYADATPLLESLQGELVPEEWRGALPLTYRTGPSIAKAHLQLAFNWDRKPLYDVVATIPGATMPDQWVIRGNHHDAWVNGAGDPLSGAVAELDEARGLGDLLKQGWHPQRTIIYCFWDGEEPALLGSTEWVEFHAAELAAHAVAYFNSDGNGRGYFRAEGSHTLENFINSVTKDVTDPETNMSVWKRERLVDTSKANAEARAEMRSRPDIRIGALGSGSDYTAFIDHVGVASVNLGFGGEDQGGGQYHSVYDDFYWYTHFPGYRLCLRQGAGADRGNDDDAHGRRGHHPLPVHRFCRYGADLRGRGEEAGRYDARQDQTAECGHRRRHVHGACGPEASPGRAGDGTATVVPKLRAARPGLRRPDYGGDGLRQGFYGPCGKRSHGAEPATAAVGARADGPGRPAESPLVPEHDLRARLLHRLRGEDAAGGSGNDRAERMEQRRRADHEDSGCDRT